MSAPPAPMAPLDLFFDLDGTLTDPQEGIVGSIRHALESLDLPLPTDDDLTWCIGPPLIESFATLLAGRASPERALALYRERFSRIGLYQNRVYPGVPETLAGLRDAGHRLHVATSKPETYAVRILDHFALSGTFETVFGAELDGTRAHKVALLDHALGQVAAAPASSVMIGDRRHDIEAARHHGLGSVGVLYGFGSEAELTAAGADALARAPEEIGAKVTGTRATR